MTSQDLPRVIVVAPGEPPADVVSRAARLLLAGGLVGFPTETVYGLGALALDSAAVAKVFVAKRRPPGHPLIVHVLGTDDARELAGEWTPLAERLALAFWPGPLTLVVQRGSRVPLAVTGGGDSVAIRATSHPIARALIAAAGPLAAPSANRYQALSATTAAHVVKSLGSSVDLVLDGGPSWAGIESTVVDARAADGRARVLRLGALGVAELRAAGMSVDVVTEAARAKDEVHVSPGQDDKHYAPRAELIIVPGLDAAAARAGHEAKTRATALVTREPVSAGVLFQVTVLPADPAAYARDIFAALHRLDDDGVACIVVEAPPANEAWAAVVDRLRRGSSRAS